MSSVRPGYRQAWAELLAPYVLGRGQLPPVILFVCGWFAARASGVPPWTLQHLLTLWGTYTAVGLWLSLCRWFGVHAGTDRWLEQRPALSAAAFVLGALLVAALAAALCLSAGVWPQSEAMWRQLPAPLTFALALHGLPLLGRWRQWRQEQGQRDRLAQQAVLSDLARQVTQTELKALQAQMEPHFLYNTLAGIQYLVRHNPVLADDMLGRLHRYLRLALPTMRAPMSTLAHELELAGHYLALAQMRLGPRLRIEMPEIEPVMATQPLAPLMLGTLIENALQHGLEPAAAGGTVRIQVTRGTGEGGGETWTLCVEDDGVGLSHGPAASAGSGLGLHNLRERLTLLHGPRARLSVGQRPGGGVRACLQLPWQTPAAAPEAMDAPVIA